jgi:hypothetical protein
MDRPTVKSVAMANQWTEVMVAGFRETARLRTPRFEILFQADFRGANVANVYSRVFIVCQIESVPIEGQGFSALRNQEGI